MKSRQQRWLSWKNYDVTATPVCPRFGCIEIFGYEFIGGDMILKGRSSTTFNRTYTDEQGAGWNNAFNNAVDLPPGQIGLCTFDLPTWAALEPGSTPTFGQFVTFGVYRPPGGTVFTIGSPWLMEIYPFPGSFYPGTGGGFNVFCGHPAIDDVAWIGGMETYMKRANSA